MKTDNGAKLAGLVGMAMKAGRLTVGCERICDAVRRDNPHIVVVIMASDAAENTVKRIVNCCNYYGCDYIDPEKAENAMTTEALGHAIGKTGAVSAIGITDEGFAKALIKITGGKVEGKKLGSDEEPDGKNNGNGDD